MTMLVGQKLGRYSLESVLGQGGMAEVYRATDTRLDRTVAIKVVLPSHARDPQFLNRFRNEAQLVAKLEHPNILPIYDFGEENGIPYLVMPYLDGGTLRDRLDGTPTALPLATLWIRQVASALDAAHAAGILHRDVKPANVLVGKGERLALADFGIAKMLESVSGLTATGVVVGTPIYMSPEQAQGRPASSATDRYALAVLAYEILAGRPPFDGESALALMNQHVTMSPPALSSRVGGLPAGLDAVFERALAKDPALRPATCRLLADQIAAFSPTGATRAISDASSAWAPDSGDLSNQPTATTVLKVSREPIPVRTPMPPGLTSEATVATRAEGVRDRRPWLVAAVLGGVAVGGVAIWRGIRPPETVPSPATVPAVPSPAPTAVKAPPEPTAVSVSVVEMVAPAPDVRLEQLTGAVEDAIAKGALAPPDPGNALEALFALRQKFPGSKAATVAEGRLVEALKREADHQLERRDPERAKDLLLRAQTLRFQDAQVAEKLRMVEAMTVRAPAPPPPPAAGVIPDEPPDMSLAAARHRIDPQRGRPTREDFEFVYRTARQVLAERPNKPEARYLETFARGGLEYLAGNDAKAGQTLLELPEDLRRVGTREARQVGMLLRRFDGSSGAPQGWELALAYLDARGEAEKLVAKELQDNPSSSRAYLGRAGLRRLQGRHQEAIDDARKSGELMGPGPGRGFVAEFLGDECAALKRNEEALDHYRRAARMPGPAAGQAALKGARLAEKLGLGPDAKDLYGMACRAGVPEACGEGGPRGEVGAPERPRDRLKKRFPR